MKKRKDFISDIYYSMNITKVTFNKHVKNILSDKQFEIYKMRFDKDGNIRMTADEIAGQLHTSRQAVDETLNKIYAKIIILCKRLKIDVDVNKKIDRPKVYNITEVREKTKELLLSIKILERLPREKALNNNVSERVFSDGTDQRRYYDSLLRDAKRIKIKSDEGEELSKAEAQKLYDYNVIIKELSNYKTLRKKTIFKNVDYASQISDLRRKTIEFIEALNETHKLPESKYEDIFNTGVKFTDGTDQRNFYASLRYKGKQAKEQFEKGNMISSIDKEKIIALKLIDNVLSFYPTKFYQNKLMILELVTSLGIDIKKNKLLFTKYYGEVYAKIRYLMETNTPIISEDGVVNSFLYISDKEMQKTYNISMKDLTDKYINGIINSELSEEVVKKLCKK